MKKFLLLITVFVAMTGISMAQGPHRPHHKKHHHHKPAHHKPRHR